MSEPIPINVGFPLGGVVKATAYEAQPEGTTVDALNVWSYQYPAGRLRGGTRPGRNPDVNWTGSDPYNWNPISWVGGHGVVGGGALPC